MRGADVVIDNYRPGVLAKFGLGHDALHAVNPAIVTCSLTGYGETGPDAASRRVRLHHPGPGRRDEPGRRARGTADQGRDLLRRPQRRHRARRWECAPRSWNGHAPESARTSTSASSTCRSRCSPTSPRGSATATPPSPRTANSAHPSLVPAQNFRTADGHLALFVGNDGMWRRFVDAVGDTALASDQFATREGRLEHRDEVIAGVQRVLLTAPSREWEARLGEVGVACGTVNDVAGALVEPQTRARGLVVQSEHPAYGRYEHVRGPLPTLGTDAHRSRAAPRRAHDGRAGASRLLARPTPRAARRRHRRLTQQDPGVIGSDL